MTKATHIVFPALLLTLASAQLLAGDTTTVTFDNGSENWVGPAGPGGATAVEPTGGNPGAQMRTVFNNFGITFDNNSTAAFLGDYTQSDSITISMDIQVDRVFFFNTDVSRPWLVELRDFDTATGGFPWTSVWFKFDEISEANNADWSTYSITFDPNATQLPAGWEGYGAEDPVTFEPMLPDGVSFSDVLSGVDEIAFTTFEPGFFFGFTDFELGIDNLSITRSTASCAADINSDGVLNFFDVSAFLSAFAAADLIADFTDDGQLNFFDVSAFLNAFSAGCP